MPDFVLNRRVWVPRPRPEVFAFFADPRNLSALSPPSAAFRWAVPPPETLSAGAVLDFTVRAFLARVRWRVMIREFDPPYRFVDAQVWGPFRRWEHFHRFVEGPERPAGPAAPPTVAADGQGSPAAPPAVAADGQGPVGTWIDDRITYGLSLRAIGGLAHTLAVRRRIADLFAYRERRLRELFAPPP